MHPTIAGFVARGDELAEVGTIVAASPSLGQGGAAGRRPNPKDAALDAWFVSSHLGSEWGMDLGGRGRRPAQ